MSFRSWPSLLLLVAACGSEVGGSEAIPPVVAEPTAPTVPGRSPATVAAPALAFDPDGAGSSTAPDEPAVITVVLFSDLDADVGSRMDGVVRGVKADLGDRVAAGQTLAVLDDDAQLARAAAARAALELASREQARVAELSRKGYVTAAQDEQASYQRAAAEAALREAEIDLQHTRILAPFAGVITRRMTGLGRPVREAEPLFRVTALQPLRALARLPELSARRVRPGMAATLTADGGAQARAVVARISPAVDPGSGTVEVLLDVPRPGPLRPGSSAALHFSGGT